MLSKVAQHLKGFTQTWSQVKEFHGSLIALSVLLLLAAVLESLGLSLIPAALTSIMDMESNTFIPDFLRGYLSQHEKKEIAVFLTIGISILILFKYILAFINTVYSSIIIRNMYNIWRCKVFDHYISGPMNEIQAEQSGSVIENMVNQPMRAATFVRFYIGIATNLILVTAMLIALLQASVEITLLFGGFFCTLAYLGSFPLKRISTKLGQEQVKLQQLVTSIASEAINGMQQIRIFAQENKWQDRFYKSSVDQSINITRSAIISEAPNIIGAFALVAIICFTVLYLLEDMASRLPLTALFVLVGQRIHTGITALMRNYSRLKNFKPSFDLVQKLKKPHPNDNRGTEAFSGHLETIKIENLHFSYPDKEPVFIDFTAKIQRGKVTAIQGPSGSGKSTLVNLICGLAEPSAGTILLNNVPLTKINPTWWLQKISLVTQDNFLFNTSIRSNLALGDDTISMDKIVQAAKQAGIHDYVNNLPRAYETIVGERGVSLSGGQVQRLAIARALIRDGDLVIFDEATSALDQENQSQIIKIMRQLADSGKIVLVISHRLETKDAVDETITILKDYT